MESLPLKLLIVAVVAAMSIVPAANALDSLRDKDFVRRAETQLEELVWTAEVVALEGLGSSRAIDLDFSSDGGLQFERMTIGDGFDGPNATAVRLVLSTGASIIRKTEMPPAPMCGADGDEVIITTTASALTIRCVLCEGEPRILVEVA